MPLPYAFFFAVLALYILPIAIAVFKRHSDMEKIVVGSLCVILWLPALMVAVFEE